MYQPQVGRKESKTMELNKGHIAFAVACFVAGAIIGAGLRSCTVKPSAPPADPVVIHDTVIVKDSANIAKHTINKGVVRKEKAKLPKAKSENPVLDTQLDTPLVAILDTCNIVEAEVPISQYEYRDTFKTDSSRIELGIQFSGYDAKIDNVDLQYQFTVQPRTIVKKKGWGQFIGVGIGVGYGASFVGGSMGTRVHAAPEVGIHVTYGWGYHW